MKRYIISKLLLALFLITGCNVIAQNIELKLDSSYLARWPNILNGEDRPIIQTLAITYDSIDRPIQYRRYFERPDITMSSSINDTYYQGDSTIDVSQVYFTQDSVYKPTLRTTTYPTSDFEEVRIVEVYSNGDWIINNKVENTYNDNGDLLTFMNYNWIMEEYVYSGKQVNTYDSDYFWTSRSNFRINQQGQEIIYQKQELIYNSKNQIEKYKEWDFQNDSLFLNQEVDYTYIDEGVSEILSSGYTQTDTFLGRENYFYLAEGEYEVYNYSKNSGTDWVLNSLVKTYESEKIIGEIQDSNFIYVYDTVMDTFLIQTSNFYNYEEYEPGKVLYQYISERYDSENEMWLNSVFREEYFHYMKNTTQVDDLSSQREQIVVYPNPTKNILYIKYEGKAMSGVEVFDNSGRQVKSSKSFSNSIDVSDLKNGLYYLRLIVDNQIVQHRFIKVD